VINTANTGKPVIVSFPPDRYAGGHLLVVTGGDSNNVYLADSSLWNRRVLTRGQFLQWWAGYAAVVTPK
jgi:predicted double-glycine peptidase